MIVKIDLSEKELEIAKKFTPVYSDDYQQVSPVTYPTMYLVKRPVKLSAPKGKGIAKQYVVSDSSDTLTFESFNEMIIKLRSWVNIDEYPEAVSLDTIRKSDLSEEPINLEKYGLPRVFIQLQEFYLIYETVAFFFLESDAKQYIKEQASVLPKGTKIIPHYGMTYGGEGDLVHIENMMSKIGKAGK